MNIKIHYNEQLQNYLIPTLYVPILFICFFLRKHSVSMWADLSPGDFVHVIGDAHVYRTHVEALEEQMRKQPKPFPVSKCWLIYCIKMIYFYSKYLIIWLFNWFFVSFGSHLQILKINPVKKDIDSFVTSDFKLVRYDPHHKIEMKMAVWVGSFYLQTSVVYLMANWYGWLDWSALSSCLTNMSYKLIYLLLYWMIGIRWIISTKSSIHTKEYAKTFKKFINFTFTCFHSVFLSAANTARAFLTVHGI